MFFSGCFVLCFHAIHWWKKENQSWIWVGYFFFLFNNWYTGPLLELDQALGRLDASVPYRRVVSYWWYKKILSFLFSRYQKIKQLSVVEDGEEEEDEEGDIAGQQRVRLESMNSLFKPNLTKRGRPIPITRWRSFSKHVIVVVAKVSNPHNKKKKYKHRWTRNVSVLSEMVVRTPQKGHWSCDGIYSFLWTMGNEIIHEHDI